MSTIPKPTRPLMSAYGLSDDTDGMLSWEWVSDQLTRSRNYWVSSTRQDGRPHAAPVWGIWLDNTLYFGSERKSVKGRNLARNPEVVIHTESGDEVVIVEGRIKEVDDVETLKPFIALYAKKYDFEPPESPTETMAYYALQPRVVLAWLEKDFPKTAARWQFG